MKKRTATILAVSLFTLSPFFFLGCDTSEGFGRDVQDLGEEIEDAAKDTEKELD